MTNEESERRDEATRQKIDASAHHIVAITRHLPSFRGPTRAARAAPAAAAVLSVPSQMKVQVY